MSALSGITTTYYVTIGFILKDSKHKSLHSNIPKASDEKSTSLNHINNDKVVFMSFSKTRDNDLRQSIYILL